MNMIRIAVGAIAVMAAVPVAVPAQWPAFKTSGVPRDAKGEPDLNGPTPRTPDGKPDLSGIWQNGRPGGGPGGGQGGGQRGGQRGGAGGGAPAAPAAPAAPPAPATPESGPPAATFGNAGSGFKDGLPYQPWAADLVKQRMADNSKDNPDAHCLPMGFMQFHNHPEPRKIIQTPGVLLIIYEANSGLRQIFTDGRSLPGKDAEPWWYGYSIGKWEGDTLVVETTGFIDGGWLDVRGSPLTEAAKVVEKFRRPNYGNLEIEITVDDPKAYTKPWTVKVNQRILPDTELIEFICQDRDATHYVGGK
jgi:hypothetical protein